MTTLRFNLIKVIVFAALSWTTIQSSVVCEQLNMLAPGIMRFRAHSAGKFIAAQEATSGPKTRLSFFTFQAGNTEGRKAKLKFLSALEREDAQGIVWDWTTNKSLFCLGTTTGRLAVYNVLEANVEEETAPQPVFIGEKTKTTAIKAVAWSCEGEHVATITDNKLIIFSLNQESRKHPIKRASATELTLENIQYLTWSHDDSMIAVGNNEKVIIYRTRTPSGTVKLVQLANQELDAALRNISGTIKDIAWNKIATPTLAVLSKKLTLISIPTPGSPAPLNMLHNFASGASAALAWNATQKSCKPEAQELIVTNATGRSYQVYTMTSRSLMFETSSHDFLPPFNQSSQQAAQSRFENKTTSNHELAESTMIELVNKLTRK